MIRLDYELLKRLAAQYLWWKPPEEAMERLERVVAQVMNLGDYNAMYRGLCTSPSLNIACDL